MKFLNTFANDRRIYTLLEFVNMFPADIYIRFSKLRVLGDVPLRFHPKFAVMCCLKMWS